MRNLFLVVVVLLGVTACKSAVQDAYYSMWEKVGVEKRDILVDRVENARESQEDAQEEFADALEEFSALINFKGGELEDVYNDLNSKFLASKASSDEVTNRIGKVESVAEALFDEWEQELEKFSNAALKRDSQLKLRGTQQRYEKMLRSMRKVEASMPPVLTALQDNVLYLKHNLNANAVGALQGELSKIQKDVSVLITEMNDAIAQSNEFIATIKN